MHFRTAIEDANHAIPQEVPAGPIPGKRRYRPDRGIQNQEMLLSNNYGVVSTIGFSRVTSSAHDVPDVVEQHYLRHSAASLLCAAIVPDLVSLPNKSCFGCRAVDLSFVHIPVHFRMESAVKESTDGCIGERGGSDLIAHAYAEMESLLDWKCAEHYAGSYESLAFPVQKTSVPKR
jgi:hypothetical protein